MYNSSWICSRDLHVQLIIILTFLSKSSAKYVLSRLVKHNYASPTDFHMYGSRRDLTISFQEKSIKNCPLIFPGRSTRWKFYQSSLLDAVSSQVSISLLLFKIVSSAGSVTRCFFNSAIPASNWTRQKPVVIPFQAMFIPPFLVHLRFASVFLYPVTRVE